MKLQWNDATATVESDDIPSWIREEKKKENMNDLSIGCYVLSECICCSRKKMAMKREERIYVTKRRLSSENHASIDAFLGRNRIVFISLAQVNPQFYLFMHENWKFLSSTTLLYFLLFSSFFGNFSKVFCEFFPSLVCFLLVDDRFFCVRASAITTSHEQTLTPIRPKSSAEFTDGIRMSETFNF